MSKIYIRVLTVAVAFLATTAFAASTPCTSTVTGTTIAGDVVVPAGETCTLVDVAVTGDVSVQAGASLYLQSTGFPSTIRGSVKAHECNVVGIGNGAPYVDPENPYGRIVVGGDLRISGCTGSPSSGCAGITNPYAQVSPVPATVLIGGDFRCTDNPSGCTAIACTIGGTLLCSGNGGVGCYVHSSTIAGDGAVDGNIFFQFSVNEFAGDLKCNDNTTGLTLANIVAGTKSGQCATGLP